MPSDPKHVVLLCDGTANHLGTDLSNIARIFRCIEKYENQLVFYNSGVGTVGADMWWSERARRAKALFEQATGYSIDRDIISIYGFLCSHYNPGDQISLFGFSRGAYTVRIVAALIHMVGVLPRDQVNLAGFALSYLKIISSKDGAADKSDFDRVYEFSRVSGAQLAEVSFLGLFDTVSSLILPGRNGPFPGLATLPQARKSSGFSGQRVNTHWVCQSAQLLKGWSHYRQDDEQVFNRAARTPSDDTSDRVHHVVSGTGCAALSQELLTRPARP